MVKGDQTQRLHRDLPTAPTAPITRLSYSELLLRLAAMFPDKRYTAHSFKHGAMSVAMQAVQTHGLDERALCHLAKHQLVQDLSETTIRYLSNDRAATIAAARSLGTGAITAHL